MSEFTFRNLSVKLIPEGAAEAGQQLCALQTRCPAVTFQCQPVSFCAAPSLCGNCSRLVSVCADCSRLASVCADCSRLASVCADCSRLASVCADCSRVVSLCADCSVVAASVCADCSRLASVCADCSRLASVCADCSRAVSFDCGRSIVCPAGSCAAGSRCSTIEITDILKGTPVIINQAGLGAAEVRAELGVLTAALREALDGAEQMQQQVAEQAKPSTVEEVDALRERLLEAVAELDEHKTRLQDNSPG